MRKGVQQKKRTNVSFSPQVSSVPSSQADSDVFVRRMFADRAPSSRLASLKSSPEDSSSPKKLFKAKLIDFGAAKAKAINATEKKSEIGPEKKLVLVNAEKTVTGRTKVLQKSPALNTPPRTKEKPITNRNSFVERK